MPITFGANIASLQIQRQLDRASEAVSRVSERLSTGLRINRASDDAAGLAISADLNSKQRVTTQGVRNVNDVISMLSIADGALSQLSEILTRQRELATQAASGHLADRQRQSLDAEHQALSHEYQRILESTEFNGRSLFGSANTVSVQAGGQEVSVGLSGIRPSEGEGLQGTGTYSQSNFLFVGTPFAVHHVGIVALDLNSDGRDDVAMYADEQPLFIVPEYSFELQTVLGTTGTPVVADSHIGTQFLKVGGPTADLGVEVSGNSFTVSFLGTGDDVRYDVGATGAITETGVGGTFNTVFEGSSSITLDFNGDGVTDRASVNGAARTFTIEVQNTAASGGSTSIATRDDALDALDTLTQQGAAVAAGRATIGSSLSRLDTIVGLLRSKSTALAEAETRISSADVAAEAAVLVQAQIRRQVAASVAAQANLGPLLALRLLRGE